MTTETRAVSAWKLWLTPLAVLVPILATGLGGALAWARVGPALGLVTIAAGLAITVAAGRRTYGAQLVLGTAVLTLVASVFAVMIAVVAALTSSNCKDTSGGWEAFALTCGALVYFAAGAVGFRFKPPFALLSVPLGAILGVIAIYALTKYGPGPSYYCGD